MSEPSSFDPSFCPMCGQPNECAMERERTTGQQQPPCWCTHVDFADELLAHVPRDAQNRACICPSCARAR